MADVKDANNFVLTREAIRAAWHALIAAKGHSHFLGYMCLRESAAKAGKETELEPNFKKFFERYFSAGGLTSSHPYLHPFARTSTQYSNVAGSYARSSLREVAPLREVAELRDDDTWTLRENHPAIARRVMLSEQPLPGLAFATFIYRDFGFSEDSATSEALQRIFRADFGLQDEATYTALFGKPSAVSANLFEKINAHA
jgi:hypothetical protein